jgi:hypothetical protein
MGKLQFLFPTLLTATLLAFPAHAQSSPEQDLGETLDKALRNLMEKMAPALDDALKTVEPLMNQALETMREFDVVDDPRHYQMPEVLPNGDIIIRRRPDAPELPSRDETQTDLGDGVRI